MLITNKEGILQQDYKQHIAKVRVDSDRAFFANIADLHMGLNHRKLFQETIKFLMTIPNLYLGLGGDCGNGANRMSKGNPKEETLTGNKQIFAIAEDLKPVVEQDRLLYIIDGNHLAGRLKDLTYDTPEETLAHLLGRSDLYKKEQCVLYFNVRKNYYVHFTQHKSSKKLDHFQWVNADVTWREHHHEYNCTHKMVLEHNKYAKHPIPKEVLEIHSGSFQVQPSYVKANGYRLMKPGCYIVEMSGIFHDWRMTPWRDEHLYHAIQNGYRIS